MVHKIAYYIVDGPYGCAPLDFRAAAVIDVAVNESSPRAADAGIDKAYRLFFRTAAGAGNARRADSDVAPIKTAASVRHFSSSFRADGRISFQCLMRDTEDFFFHFIAVRPGRTAEVIGSTRDIGNKGPDQASRTGLSCTDDITSLTDFPSQYIGHRFVVKADDLVIETAAYFFFER